MDERLRVLIVDDETPARAKLQRMLGQDPRFECCGEARSGTEALNQIPELKPDLVLLDIQMPGLTGLEVLEALDPPLPQIIFATAYDQYAVEAFDRAAVDYLLKPFEESRFLRALERAWSLRRSQTSLTQLLGDCSKRPLERLVVKDGDRWIPVALRTVHRLKAEGRLVRIFSSVGEFTLRRSLSELEARLDAHRFIRVHRSDLVAVESVAHLEPWDHGDALLVLKGGGHVVLSRTYRQAFLERWGLEG